MRSASQTEVTVLNDSLRNPAHHFCHMHWSKPLGPAHMQEEEIPQGHEYPGDSNLWGHLLTIAFEYYSSIQGQRSIALPHFPVTSPILSFKRWKSLFLKDESLIFVWSELSDPFLMVEISGDCLKGVIVMHGREGWWVLSVNCPHGSLLPLMLSVLLGPADLLKLLHLPLEHPSASSWPIRNKGLYRPHWTYCIAIHWGIPSWSSGTVLMTIMKVTAETQPLNFISLSVCLLC